MDTKSAILEKARGLFNRSGLNAVSLRDIAKAAGISYGNLTYHFPNKEKIVLTLYSGMMEEHKRISDGFHPDENLLEKMLLAPLGTFDISRRYRFLFADFVDIMRQCPTVAGMQAEILKARQAAFKGLFGFLKTQGMFRKDIDDGQVDYLMELSGVVRTYFFMKAAGLAGSSDPVRAQRTEYVLFTGKLLRPYLTGKGARIFNRVLYAPGAVGAGPAPESPAPGVETIERTRNARRNAP